VRPDGRPHVAAQFVNHRVGIKLLFHRLCRCPRPAPHSAGRPPE
jgi:hypothetical protein